jgi:hypothetical protein
MRTALYLPKHFGRNFTLQEVLGAVAVLDHNHHVHRSMTTPRLAYVKRTKNFIAQIQKEPKSYSYYNDLVRLVCQQAVSDLLHNKKYSWQPTGHYSGQRPPKLEMVVQKQLSRYHCK